MERYAKYREQIRRMTPEEFPTPEDAPRSAEAAESTSPLPFEEARDDSATGGPYALYLSKRKVWLAIKIILFLLAVAGFVIWWVLMQGRR